MRAKREPLADWTPPAFRFSPEEHQYISLETGEEIPSVTGLLSRAGLVDDQWMTEASRVRGSAVHALTSRFDLHALDVETCDSPHKGYLLGHAKAMSLLRPDWWHVEQPFCHRRPLYAGRPDRVGKLGGAVCVFEIKSGAPMSSHAVQLSLQAILITPTVGLPAESIQRFALYLRGNGKFHVEQFTNQSDYHQARDILSRFCT